MDNIAEFWSKVDDSLFSDEMVFSKISIYTKKSIGLMLQRKQPNIGEHLFTMEECRDQYINPLITKEVLSHLIFVKVGDEDSDIINKQMNLVEVTFDQKNEDSVMATIMSVFTHLDDKLLPALAETAHFQKKMVDLLNDKLQKSLRKMYTTFNLKMMELKPVIATIEEWISAFNHGGSTIVRDDTKASSWAQPNSNSSNSQGDRPQRDNDWHKHKKPKDTWNDNNYQQSSWNYNSYQNQGEMSSSGDQTSSEVNTEKVKPVRSTMAELLKTELKYLCNGCGWKVDPG